MTRKSRPGVFVRMTIPLTNWRGALGAAALAIAGAGFASPGSAQASSADVAYDRKERAAGTPQQTFRRLARYALDGVFSFSHLPLRLVTYTGIFVAGIGFAIAVFFAVRRILDVEIAPTGFTTLAMLSLFIGGVQLIGIGILGEYLGRIYDEVKRRPNYIVKSTAGSHCAPPVPPRD